MDTITLADIKQQYDEGLHCITSLKAAIQDLGIDPHTIDWYRDAEFDAELEVIFNTPIIPVYPDMDMDTRAN